MDLDPLLRPVDDGESTSPFSGDGRIAATISSTPSQSGHFNQQPQPHAPIYHGQDSPDTPPSTFGRDGAETQQPPPPPPPQQHHPHPHHQHPLPLPLPQHQQRQQHYLGRGPALDGDGDGIASSSGGVGVGVGGIGVDAAKKARACEACRGLKVRCEPGPDEEGPCKRCTKADRACVVTMPTRKRQKKTDSRVSELEKKIDALTASLQGSVTTAAAAAAGAATLPGSSSGGGGGGGGGYSTALPAADASSGYGPSPSWAGSGSGGSRSWGDNHNHNNGNSKNNHNNSSSSMETSPSTSAIQRPSPVVPPGGPSPDYHQQQPQQPFSHPLPPPHHPQTTAFVTVGQKRKEPDNSEQATGVGDGRSSWPGAGGGWLRPHQGDIVDRGLMSMDYAAAMFDRYRNDMAPHLPAVVFPPGTTVMELRHSKPVLFLAIMAAATSENHILQGTLAGEFLQTLAEKVFLTGEKSVELVQALLIACIWYWPPEHFEELKFYQLVHLAAVMSIDMGLGKRTAVVHKRAPPPSRRKLPPDPMSLECRRTWLICFYLALNTSMAMRRPNLIRWTSFMAESVELLQTSPDAAPSDKYLCHLVNTHRLADQVGGQFSMEDAPNVVSIEDARTQYSLKALERDLDKCIASVPREMMNPMLDIGFNIVNLYMHELALHSDTADQWRPPFSAESLKDSFVGSEPLSAAHINALSACLTAIENIFDSFLSMDVPTCRCVPVFTFMRVAYSVVILIKLYITASGHASEMGMVISKDKMRVEYYLGALIDKFRATAADNKSRFAAKFLVVLVMFRSWFYKRIQSEARGDATPHEDTAASAAAFDRPLQAAGSQQQQQSRRSGQLRSPPQQNQQQQQKQDQQGHQQPLQNVNTPLQLLSEVATGRNQGNHPPPRHIYNNNSNNNSNNHLPSMGRQPAQPFFRGNVPVAPGMVSETGSQPANRPSLGHLQGLSPSSVSGTSGSDLDPTGAAMPSGFSPWMSTPQGLPPDLSGSGGAEGSSAGGPGGSGGGDGMPSFDLEMLGITVTDPHEFCQNSMRVFMDDPWFSSNVQGLPDPNQLLFR